MGLEMINLILRRSYDLRLLQSRSCDDKLKCEIAESKAVSTLASRFFEPFWEVRLLSLSY